MAEFSQSVQSSTAILPAGLWDDLKSVTCLGSRGYDGSIESVIALLMEEDWARECAAEAQGVRSGGFASSTTSAGPQEAAGEGGEDKDADMSFVRRRKKSATASSSDVSNGHDEAAAATTVAEDSREAKKKAKEAAALARLAASHSYLLSGQHN